MYLHSTLFLSRVAGMRWIPFLLLFCVGCGGVTLWDNSSHDRHVDKRKVQKPENDAKPERHRKRHKAEAVQESVEATESLAEKVADTLIRGGSLKDAQVFYAINWRVGRAVDAGLVKTAQDAKDLCEKLATELGWVKGKYPELSALMPAEQPATDIEHAAFYDELAEGAAVAIGELY